MKKTNRGNLFPLTYVFASFFGAAMIAGVFAYNNYRFSQYKFIDFSELIFYEQGDIFVPKNDEYMLVVYSSNQSNFEKFENNLNIKTIAIDIMQKKRENKSNISYISSDINTILKLLNTFNIASIPSSVKIVHQKNQIYKQDSKINKI
ncbi:hypothetical protein BFG04_05865 [Campylobacter pinnipediorum subsp. pinnipediorum]|uniref:Periplasmic protein n=1 Tax=Campylobacter pinnipediorum subsp. pinnipediorum TaxID=1660067 RepID=A0AAX0L8Q5_9BACT|nr:hypothetical protein [Campylobacter pinnipediorum]AQW83876.1 hypothetical protein CPIN17262_0138 [Campylobacter pinnipediorum subsp. pinnipediorum]OPA75012.1 hypothetical protein BFG04_05865 [Campylobacter pinnipediorum subsp. pinnipediorum]